MTESHHSKLRGKGGIPGLNKVSSASWERTYVYTINNTENYVD